jgi:hypothetical protein
MSEVSCHVITQRSFLGGTGDFVRSIAGLEGLGWASEARHVVL